jgi:hypothetical protein
LQKRGQVIHAAKLTRITSRQFLHKNNTAPATPHWILSESILLNELIRKAKRTSLLSLQKVTRLFNAVVESNPEFGTAKTIRQVQFKWRAKQRKRL